MNFTALIPLLSNLVPFIQEVMKLVSKIDPEEINKIEKEFMALVDVLKQHSSNPAAIPSVQAPTVHA